MSSKSKLSCLAALLVAFSVALVACGGKEERKAMHMEKGKAYYEQANYDKARVEVRNVLQIDPKNAEAYYLLGLIEEEQQNWQNAFNSYAKTVELNPDQIDAKVRLGRLYVFSGALDETEKIANEILAKHPAHAGALFLKAAVLARKGNINGAIEEANRAVAADPAEPHARSLLGGLYSRAGDDAKAQEVLETGVKLNPRNIPLRMDLASVLMKRQAFDKAEQAYRDIVDINPAKLAYRANLTAFYTSTNQLEKAEKTLREAIQADPDDTQRYVLLAEFLATKKGPEQAEKELMSAIKTKPRAYTLQFTLARLYELTDRPDRAEQTYKDIIASDKTAPDGLRARTQLARIKVLAGDTAEADRLVADVLKENPKDSDALQLRAQLELAKGDFGQAIVDLRAVLKDHPDSDEIVGLLARAHMANGEPKLARDVLDNAIVRYPHNSNLHAALADLLLFTKDYDGAVKELDTALAADRQNARALQLKADIQISIKQWSGAEETLTNLKTILPEQPVGYYRLGLVYVAEKKYDQAIAEFEMALTKAPRAAEPLTAIVNVLLAQGKAERAVTRINQALQDFPNGFTPHLLLGEVYGQQKKYGEAEAQLRKAIEINRKAPRPYWVLSNLSLARGDTKAALEVLQQGVDASPGDRGLLQALAETYQKVGDNDKAIAVYENILKKAPTDDLAANNLASLLTEVKGDKVSLERALELTKRFENASNPALLDTLGWVYFKLGQNDHAVPLLQRAADAAPQLPVYQYHLGMAFYRQGDKKSAKIHLKRAIDTKMNFAGIEEARGTLAKM